MITGTRKGKMRAQLINIPVYSLAVGDIFSRDQPADFDITLGANSKPQTLQRLSPLLGVAHSGQVWSLKITISPFRPATADGHSRPFR